MTLAEALSEGLQVTAIGLIIVFAVLIILMAIMMLMKVVFYKPENKEVPAPKAAPQETSVSAKTASNDIEEGELIAVLTAAIAASLNTSTYNLNIKSYKRITNTSPAWNKAGLKDVIDARF